FLAGVAAKKGRWRELTAKVDCVTPLYYWMGHGRDPLEVAFAQSTRPLSQAELKDLWRSRHGNAAVPLLLVVAYPRDGGARAHVCGPTGETTLVADVELSQAERLAMAGLAEPDRHLAIRTLETSLTQTVDEVPGLRNRGLLATHELLKGVPRRADWARATQTS